MFCINSELFSGCFFLEKQMRTKKKKKETKKEILTTRTGVKHCHTALSPGAAPRGCAGVRVLPGRMAAGGARSPLGGRDGVRGHALDIMQDLPGPKQRSRPGAPVLPPARHSGAGRAPCRRHGPGTRGGVRLGFFPASFWLSWVRAELSAPA